MSPVRDYKALSDMAQALRRAHCSREGAEHECVGTCFISRSGVQLECQLCGSDSQLRAEGEGSKDVARARAIVEAAGLSWDALSYESQRDAAQAIGRTP